jgi:hypothetical protein
VTFYKFAIFCFIYRSRRAQRLRTWTHKTCVQILAPSLQAVWPEGRHSQNWVSKATQGDKSTFLKGCCKYRMQENSWVHFLGYSVCSEHITTPIVLWYYKKVRFNCLRNSKRKVHGQEGQKHWNVQVMCISKRSADCITL